MKRTIYGLIALVIFGVCCVPLIVYTCYMKDYPISANGDWSVFAALWSAAFGAIGSIATAVTLAFLIWQYFLNNKNCSIEILRLLISKNIKFISNCLMS